MHVDYDVNLFTWKGKVFLRNLNNNRILSYLAVMESLEAEIRMYCFSQFWTIHEKNYDTVPAVSPPFRSFIFLSFLNILAF